MILLSDSSMWHQRIRRLGISVVLVFAVLFIWLRLTSVHGIDRFGNPLAPDFAQFYVAGKLAATGQISRLYDEPFFFAQVNAVFGVPKESDGYPFLYPPFVAWISVPFSWVPYPVSASVYLLCQVGLAVALGRGIARRLLTDPLEVRDAAWLFVAAIPTVRCVLYGQNGLISLGILWSAYVLWSRRQGVLSGLVLALGLYKPQIFIGAFAWALLFGGHRVRLGMTLGAVMLAGVGSLGGVTLWQEWLEAARRVHDSPLTRLQMHSWWNAFDLWQPLPSWLLVVRNVVGAALGGVWSGILLWLRFRAVGDLAARRGYALVVALVGGILVTPRFCQYDLLILYPVLLMCWQNQEQRGGVGYFWARRWLAAWVVGLYVSDFLGQLGVPIVTMLTVVLFAWTCKDIRHSESLSRT